ncbi:hypothetical protein Pfra02_39660 [Pseudomonas fragi]|nr:hypothetical protein Pfra02_39660 [Pseudomonas fragi]
MRAHCFLPLTRLDRVGSLHVLYTDFLPALAAKGLALFLIDEVRGTDLYAAGSLSGLRVVALGVSGCLVRLQALLAIDQQEYQGAPGAPLTLVGIT